MPLTLDKRCLRRRRPRNQCRRCTKLLLLQLIVNFVLCMSASGLTEGRRRDTGGSGALPKQPLRAKRAPTTVEHLVAGTIGGMSGVLLTYPLDTLRVRMQISGRALGPARIASTVLREMGVGGFYRGVMSPLAGTGLIKASVFGSCGLFQSILRRTGDKAKGELTLGQLGLAAMGSGLVGAFVVTPVERVKIVMQAAAASAPSSSKTLATGHRSVWGCARGLVAEYGVRQGLYASLGPTLIREVPGYAAYFATYEACKRFLLSESRAGDEYPRGVMFRTAIAGSLAGVAAWLPVYPADVIKSRMQSAGPAGGDMIATATSIWRKEGIVPFYRGLTPALVKAAVNHAATFVVYEMVLEFMRTSYRAENLESVDLAENARAEP